MSLKQARQIAQEYSEPNNMIDTGNLFFALGEFITAADKLAEALERYRHVKLFDDKDIGGPTTADQALTEYGGDK